MEQAFLELKMEQDEVRRKDAERRRESEKQLELRNQQRIAETERARAEQERKDSARMEQERLRANTALQSLAQVVVLAPPVHLSRSLAGKTTYEFRGPQLNEVRTLYASRNWHDLARLLDCLDSRSSGSDLSEDTVREWIRKLRDKTCFFLFKTTAQLPETRYSKSGIQISQGHHFFYVAIPLPIDTEGDLANVPPFEFDYTVSINSSFGWRKHPDGEWLMRDWSPK